MCFKQAQPKIDDTVKNNFFNFFDPYFLTIFLKELETAIYPKLLVLLT